MRNRLMCLFAVILISGCAHCSKIVSHFEGKTKGLNPYGDGNAVVDRESYWGDRECILRLIERDAPSPLPDISGLTASQPPDLTGATAEGAAE